MLNFKVFHSVLLSPVQVCTYLCIPGHPDLDIKYGLKLGANSFWAVKELFSIKKVWIGLIKPTSIPSPNPLHLALESHTSYSLLSFHVESIPYSNNCSVTLFFHQSIESLFVKSIYAPVSSQNCTNSGSFEFTSFINKFFSFISSNLGWSFKNPGFIFAQSFIPFLWKCSVKALISGNFSLFQLNTYLLSPIEVYPDDNWNEEHGISWVLQSFKKLFNNFCDSGRSVYVIVEPE